MGTERVLYFRMRCMTCREPAEDRETEEEIIALAKEHDTIVHNKKSHAELGKFISRENYWAFPL